MHYYINIKILIRGKSMKKKLLSLALVIILGMLLCSCSGNSTEKMFGVKLPSGKKLELYMSREKAEDIMSDYEYEYDDYFHVYDYGFIELRYTDGLVSYIYCTDESEAAFLNGLGIGSTNYEEYGFMMDGQHSGSIINYKQLDGKYEKSDEYNKDMEFKEGIQVYIKTSKETKEITALSVYDIYSGFWRDYDE